MLRLFARGNLEEPLLSQDLRNAGVNVMDTDPDTGKQWEFSALGDHFVCKLDGAGVGFIEAPTAWHVIEYKTHSDKSFNEVQRTGAEKAKPEHWAQMQVGMGLSGIDRAMYVAINKNNDDIYLERVPLDKKAYTRLMQRAKEIIFAGDPPERIQGASMAFWKCKMCDYRNVCHDEEVARVNCRTCCHSVALEDGGWACDKHQRVLSFEEQQAGCADHRHRVGMIPEVAHRAVMEFNGKAENEKAVS